MMAAAHTSRRRAKNRGWTDSCLQSLKSCTPKPPCNITRMPTICDIHNPAAAALVLPRELTATDLGTTSTAAFYTRAAASSDIHRIVFSSLSL